MEKSSITEKDEWREIGNQIEIIHFRVPKKNHDAMILFCNQFNDIFKKYGILQWEIFQLSSKTDNMIEGFTNISQTVSANPNEEEVWMELLSYKDKNHKEEVMEKMKNDKNCEQGYRQFLDLIAPGSKVIYGDFSRLNDLGFV
ncbi:MAG TPA: DUF1428 family protein [Nitrososphaeraceae archaeon]|nr:DUF1428 family protein [Nitrososphaeraceae archaeon]